VPARRNWLGLELVDERQWLVVPLGLGLGTGYLGVALFLAELGRVSGVDRYLATAHETVAAVPELVAALAERPDLVAAIGYGGYHGLGGVAYGLARIGVLLDDGVLRDLAATTVDLAARVPPGADVGWATGTAGCLAAMTAVHAELGLPAAARLADRCAATLTGTEPGDVAPREAAGVAVALAGREGVAGHAGRLLDVAVPVGPGWCGGAAGALVAAARLGRPTARLARELATCPPLRDHSLCHGELGILEALRIAGEPSRTGAVLAALDRTGPTCGTPRGVPTPALLTGLSGIGHQLLRLGFDEVPSVLLLEPGSRSR
jgi:lantibiotic modifying enzyme